MSEVKHTALPWEALEVHKANIGGQEHYVVEIVNNEPIKDYPNEDYPGMGVAFTVLPQEDYSKETLRLIKANAAFIIQACNNHYALLEALEETLEAARLMMNFIADRGLGEYLGATLPVELDGFGIRAKSARLSGS